MAQQAAGDGFMANPGKFYGIYAAGFLGLVILLLVVEQVGVPEAVVGYLLVAATLASYAFIGVLSRTMLVSQYYVAGRQIPAVYNGMATAADWISTVSFLGLAGTIFVLGHDGLAFVLGWTGGFVLLAVLIAPYMRKCGTYTVPDFLAARFGGTPARLLGVLVLLCVSFALVLAQLHAIGILGSRVLGIEFESAVYLGMAVILLCSVLGGMLAVTWTQVAQYIVLIIAVVIPVVLLSVQHYGVPIPQLSYAQALQEIAALEQQIDGAGLEVAESLQPYLQPFTNTDPFNFFALILSLMVGTASLPHILMRSFTTPSVRAARTSVGWSLLFIVILFLTAPAYAAFAKLEVFHNVIGQSLESLPQWIYTYGRLGLVQICGADATTPEAIGAACAAFGEPDGVLGFGELSIDRDVIVMATPEMAGLPFVFVALLAAGVLAAALSTATGLLLAMANALSHDVYYRMVDPNAPTGRRLVIARVLLIAVALVAGYVAAMRPAGILSTVAWAFSLAAAGYFPALVLGIWWKRCTSVGALAGILAGFGVTLFYMVGTQYGFDLAKGTGDELALWTFFGLTDGVPNISAAIFGVPVGFAVMILVSLITPAPSNDMLAFIDEVRRPRGAALLQDRAA